MSGFLGAIESVVGDMAGSSGGGNFLQTLMSVIEQGMGQAGGNSGGSSSTGSEIAQIAGEVLPIVAAFL